jgi:hypothetical protein
VADIIEPLPKEPPSGPPACLSDWTFVLPADLTPAPVCKAPATTPAVENWTQFETFLNASHQSTEGLVLLAHHATGSISFDKTSTKYARPSDLTSSFKPGSVAMVIACNAGALATSNQYQYGNRVEASWLWKFNKAGMDAEIVSAFDVQADFGACLARHIANQVTLARQNATDLSLLQLFKLASDKVREDYLASESPVFRRQADAVYEFILAGDGSLRMCPR